MKGCKDCECKVSDAERIGFSKQELADRLGCSLSTVQRAIKAGRINTFKFNRRRFISKEEVERITSQIAEV